MLSLVAATFLEGRSPTRVAPAEAMTIHCGASAVVFTVLAVATGNAARPGEPVFWTAVVWLVVLSTFDGYGLYWIVMRRSGVTRVNTLMFLMAPVTAVWGALMFDEPFGARTAVGLAIGLTAVVVVHRGARAPGLPCAGRSLGSPLRRRVEGRAAGGAAQRLEDGRPEGQRQHHGQCGARQVPPQ